jgi:hypothetical protein
MIYVPSAHPGCLAPHLWLADGSSIYDHFGNAFTLLIADGDRQEVAGFERAAESLGIPLKLLSLSDRRLRNRYSARFALIRPDQHVAWRGNTLPSNPETLLARVTGAEHRKAGVEETRSLHRATHGKES